MPSFLFTDIEGSTRLWEESPEAMTGALARHDAILASAVESSGGSVVKTTGDGMLAVFPAVRDALSAAMGAQRSLGSESWQVGPISVRMGIHSGETESRDGDYFGQVMNRAARIMAAGHGGQILVSGAAAATADRLPDGAFLRDLGMHRLKDLTLPEHLFQMVHADLVADFPPPATLESRPNNLPAQATEFLGRGDALSAIEVMISSPSTRLLTIVGPGGAGKTRLGIQAGAEQLDKFRDGVFFVDLSDERDPDAAYEVIVRTLGLPLGKEPLQVLESRLRDREMLLVLDNFEQVVAAGVGISQLLQTAPGVKVIVTSRETLRVRAEHVFPVPPLTLPHPKAGLEAISQAESVQLFVERARAVRPDFGLDEDNAPLIAEICLRLDGLPLAIELAAARLKIFTPVDLIDRLRQRLDVLGAGGRDLPDRQRTLWGAIGWSYELLDTDECRLFGLMSVFSGADLRAIEEVGANAGFGGDVLDLLTSLVDKSLIRSEESLGTQRFSMLLMIKEYAATRLDDDPDFKEGARRAHADYFSNAARQLQEDLRGARRDTALEEVGLEIGNLRSAWRYWVEREDLEMLFTLIDSLWALQEAKGWYQAAIELATDTLDLLATAEASPDLQAEELALRTSLARALMAVKGYGPEVETAFREVLEMMGPSGTAAQRVPVLRALATYYMNLSDFAKCADMGMQLIELGEAEGDESIRLAGHYQYGVGTAFVGNMEEGLAHLATAVELFDPKLHSSRRFSLGPNIGVAARNVYGLLLFQSGAMERGVSHVSSALEVAHEIDHPYSVAYAGYHNGFLALLRERYEECARFARELAMVAEEHDYAVWGILAQVLDGASKTAMGSIEEGLALTERGIELYQGLTTPPVFWPEILNLRAMVHAMAGRPETAVVLVDEAIGVEGDGNGYPSHLISRGDFLRMLADPDLGLADEAYETAAELSRDLGLTLFELVALTRLVDLRRSTGVSPDRRSELESLYGKFTEGFDEQVMVMARRVLGV